MNLALLEEGLRDARTVVAHHLFEKNGKTLLSSDTWSTAQLLCAGAIEARVLGAGAPAMSITGSGSHGIIAVMPAVCRSEGGRIRRRGAFAGGSVEYARDAVHKRVLRKAFRDVRLRRRSGNGHGVRALYAARRQSFADFYDASQYGAFHHGHDL